MASSVMGQTQADHAYRRLRTMIVDCELAPGSFVSEPELTARLELGKSAVRAALLRMSHDGLVTAVPRYGYRIAPLDVKDALEITQLRLLTEPVAMRLAASRIDLGVVEAARKLYLHGYDPTNAKSIGRYMTGNRQFKLAMAQASGNKRLAIWIEEISEAVDRYLRVGVTAPDMSAKIAETVVPICDALLARDGEKAEAASIDNILAITATILSTLFGHEANGAAPFTSENVATLLGVRRQKTAGRAP